METPQDRTIHIRELIEYLQATLIGEGNIPVRILIGNRIASIGADAIAETEGGRRELILACPHSVISTFLRPPADNIDTSKIDVGAAFATMRSAVTKAAQSSRGGGISDTPSSSGGG